MKLSEVKLDFLKDFENFAEVKNVFSDEYKGLNNIVTTKRYKIHQEKCEQLFDEVEMLQLMIDEIDYATGELRTYSDTNKFLMAQAGLDMEPPRNPIAQE